MKVDFSKAVKINGVALQERQDANQWVTSYTLSYSQDDGIYTAYEKGKEIKESIDRNTPVVHALKPPIIARYIRVHVKGYSSKPCMRLEFFGRRKGFTATATSCVFRELGPGKQQNPRLPPDSLLVQR